jgi:hypothetical protein
MISSFVLLCALIHHCPKDLVAARSHRDDWVVSALTEEAAFENCQETWLERPELDNILQEIHTLALIPDPRGKKTKKLENEIQHEMRVLQQEDLFIQKEHVA